MNHKDCHIKFHNQIWDVKVQMKVEDSYFSGDHIGPSNRVHNQTYIDSIFWAHQSHCNVCHFEHRLLTTNLATYHSNIGFQLRGANRIRFEYPKTRWYAQEALNHGLGDDWLFFGGWVSCFCTFYLDLLLYKKVWKLWHEETLCVGVNIKYINLRALVDVVSVCRSILKL